MDESNELHAYLSGNLTSDYLDGIVQIIMQIVVLSIKA